MTLNSKENGYFIPAIKMRHAAAKLAASSFGALGILFVLFMIADSTDASSEDGIFSIILFILMLVAFAVTFIGAIISVSLAIGVAVKRNACIKKSSVTGRIFKAGRTFHMTLMKDWSKTVIGLLIKMAVAALIPGVVSLLLFLFEEDAEVFEGFVALSVLSLFSAAMIGGTAGLYARKEYDLYKMGDGDMFWQIREADTSVFNMLDRERAVIVSMQLWKNGVEDMAANLCRELDTDPSTTYNYAYRFTGEEINRYYEREIVGAAIAADLQLIAVPVVSCTGGERQYLISAKNAKELKRCLIEAGGIDYGWFSHCL